MMMIFWLVVFVAITGILAYQHAARWIWAIAMAAYLLVLTRLSQTHFAVLGLYWLVYLGAVGILAVKPVRQQLLSRPILSIYRKIMPKISRTEQEALDAGTVGWDGELFTGKPAWEEFFKTPPVQLTAEEKAFLDGPVTKLCSMVDDWEITHERGDMSPELWQFIKDEGFFGLIIPKEYGGKGFSALAHSEILVKLASRGVTVASTVAVPNSLGPAELLLHYGTKEQKDYYLPRLARGEEVPCFALTGPRAGSDAGSMPDTGVICKGQFDGKEVLGIKLNFDKRYITLAPVATVIGLAFKLYDPEHLIGDEEDIGITSALIPATTAGVVKGNRHLPLNNPFQNGPISGKDVFIPLDYIIGGKAMAGQGWRMLVESLSCGRAISIPSMVTGGARALTVATGAYARIRKQFGHAIGYFEGVQDALARMAYHAYTMEALRVLTVSMVDQGGKPSVPSAITKYHTSQCARDVACHAMDIHGGKGICLGPKNYVGRAYQGAPISITVEGANILTRSLIIFGQGAMRCHPYVLAEIDAAKLEDAGERLKQFDTAIFNHISFVMANVVRSVWLGVGGHVFAWGPKGVTKKYVQYFTRYSANLALISDVCMLTMGGELKRKESLSARLGDILSLLYMGSAVLKRFHDQGEPQSDIAMMKYCIREILFEIQQRLDEVIRNMPNRIAANLLKPLIFPIGRRFKPASDNLSHHVAKLLLTPNSTRARLGEGIYRDPEGENQLAALESALKAVIAAEAAEKRLAKAVQKQEITAITLDEQLQQAQQAGILSAEDVELIQAADAARQEIIAVDDFAPEELMRIVGQAANQRQAVA